MTGDQLLAYLRATARGRDKAITAKQLANAFGTNEREVREMIGSLREAGHLIGSATSKPWGFYVPRNRDEAEETSRQLWSRVGQIAKTAKAFDRAANSEYGLGYGGAEQIRLMLGQ